MPPSQSDVSLHYSTAQFQVMPMNELFIFLLRILLPIQEVVVGLQDVDFTMHAVEFLVKSDGIGLRMLSLFSSR